MSGRLDPSIVASEGRRSGRVLAWFDARGWGFLGCDDGAPDVFVHYTAIEGSGHRSLEPGQRVSFETVRTPEGKRRRAFFVQVLE